MVVGKFETIGQQLADALAAKSQLTDSLLGEVLERQRLEAEVADLKTILAARDQKIEELGFQLGESEAMNDTVRQSLNEEATTVQALTTRADPKYLRKAAALVRKFADESDEMAAADPLFALVVAIEGHSNTSADMREGARQLEELALAIERANDVWATR